MFKIFTALCLSLSIAGFSKEIALPSQADVYGRFKTEKMLTYFKAFGYDDLKASQIGFSQVKGEKGVIWEKYHSQLAYRSRMNTVWPKDLCVTHVLVSLPKNKFGESFKLTYRVGFQRSHSGYGNVYLGDTWRKERNHIYACKIENNALTADKVKDLLLEYWDEKRHFLGDAIKITALEYMADREVNIDLGEHAYSAKGNGVMNGSNRVYVFKIAYLSQFNDKLTLKGIERIEEVYQLKLKRVNGVWEMAGLPKFDTRLVKEDFDEIKKVHGTIEQLGPKAVYLKLNAFQVEPNSNEGKQVFIDQVYAIYKGLALTPEHKAEDISKLQSVCLGKDPDIAKMIWEKMYAYKMKMITLSNEKISTGRSIKSYDEGKAEGESDFNFQYRASRSLSKAEIKALKQKYGKANLAEWQKPIEKKTTLYDFKIIFTNQEWGIKDIEVRTINGLL